MPKIICTFTRTGETRIEVEGESGAGCVEKTQSVEQALAGNPQRTFKPEYDDAAASAEAVQMDERW